MNILWPRIFKSAYRREPVLSFIGTVGAVDVVIGGFSQHGSLLFLGLSTVGATIALRWWQVQHTKSLQTEQVVPKYYLPPRSTRHLPVLSMSKHNPPD